jgi:DNA-binding beta-propeller fold protein YncE
VDPAGNVYVTDTDTDRVLMLAADPEQQDRHRKPADGVRQGRSSGNVIVAHANFTGQKV